MTVGVILPVENKKNAKLTKTHPLFYTFCQNTAAMFLLKVKLKMAAPQIDTYTKYSNFATNKMFFFI